MFKTHTSKYYVIAALQQSRFVCLKHSHGYAVQQQYPADSVQQSYREVNTANLAVYGRGEEEKRRSDAYICKTNNDLCKRSIAHSIGLPKHGLNDSTFSIQDLRTRVVCAPGAAKGVQQIRCFSVSVLHCTAAAAVRLHTDQTQNFQDNHQIY